MRVQLTSASHSYHVRDAGLDKALVDGPPGVEVRGEVAVSWGGTHTATSNIIPMLPWLHGSQEVNQLGVGSIPGGGQYHKSYS